MKHPSSAYFSMRYISDPRRDAVWREVCRYLQARYIPGDSKILDLGAGYCSFINNIKGRERHALDYEPKTSVYGGEGVQFHIQTCTRLVDFRDEEFDIAFASNLFEHLSREETALSLREIHRVLRPGGKLVVLQPNFRYSYKRYFDDYTHLQAFSHTGLCDLLCAYQFEVVDVEPRFLPFSFKGGLPAWPILVRLYLRSPIKPLAGQMLVVARKGIPYVEP